MTALFLLILLIGLPVLVSAWAALVTYSFFWYENAWRVRSELDGGSKLKGMVLSGLLSSITSVILIMVWYPLGLIRRLWLPQEICAGRPVIILTHGLYHNPSAWLLFRRRLRRAGFKNIFIMNYGSFFTSFEQTLKKFEKFVADAQKKVPNQPVYLIGHSLGGLLSRVYAEKSGGATVPAAVITLGSPHQGSKIAVFALSNLAASLIYRGPLFAKIESGAERLPCTGIALISPVDNMVLPSEAMRVPYTGWSYCETDPVSHTAMLYSKSTANRVIELLHAEMVPLPQLSRPKA